MNRIETVLENKKPNFEKVRAFGFLENGGNYTYHTPIAGGQLRLTVTIAGDGGVSTEVFDPESGGEYVLHSAAGAAGAFAGMVRTDCGEVLARIAEECFEPDVFKSDYAQKVIAYIRNAYGGELEFLWRRFPDNAIWRRGDTNKWYGALLVLSKRKLGLDSDDRVEVIDLRMEPEEIERVTDGRTYFPGFHMNKRHWCSICLDGSVPIEEIFQRIDESYGLAVK